MLAEIRAAVEHVCSLLVSGPSSEQVDGFRSTLSARLQSRYACNWFPADGERGSASRALLWHQHGGGEGLDVDVQHACRLHLMEKPSMTAGHTALFALFVSPFTLWVDPGCVAVRLGHGPGTFLEGAPHLIPVIKVLYGALPTRVLPAMHPRPPVVTLLPSTPSLDVDTPTQFASAMDKPADATVLHFRSPSHSSNYSNSATSSASRTVSLGGSSRSSSMGLSDSGSEACPSLVAASSTRGDSDSELDEDDSSSELSIEDMMDRGGFKNFDIIDDDEEDQALEQALDRRLQLAHVDDHQGETTVAPSAVDGDETVRAVPNPASSTQDPQADGTGHITSYDGGNVGVLGGGIRLGASKAVSVVNATRAGTKPKPTAPAWHPAQAWTSTTNLSDSPASLGAGLPPPMALPVPHPNAMAKTWSSFSPSISSYNLPSPSMASPYLNTPSIGPHGTPQASSMAHQSQYVIIDGYAVPLAMAAKRGRARGRRSRGRGAGRAARRQAAAAMKSQQDSQGLLGMDETEMGNGLNDDFPSALGITLSDSTLATDKVIGADGIDAEARLMAIVRQRADQVAKDLVRRHLEQQQRNRSDSCSATVRPAYAARSFTPRMQQAAYTSGSPAMHAGAQPVFQAPPSSIQHRPQHAQHYARPAFVPAHMAAHMHQQPMTYSPISHSPSPWMH